jgi:hypothetical protein
MKPQGQYRTGLMSYPQPGELDHGCSQPRVSGFGDTLFVSNGSAPPWRRRQSGIGGNLPSVGKASEQSLRPLGCRRIPGQSPSNSLTLHLALARRRPTG